MLDSLIAIYYAQSQELDRLWTYFSAVAFGVLAVSWTGARGQDAIPLLALAFLAFSAGNCWIVCRCHKRLLVVREAILEEDAYKKATEPQKSAFGVFDAYPVAVIGGVHASLGIAGTLLTLAAKC